MASREKIKGSKFELDCVKYLMIEHNHNANKVPLSGSVGGEYSGDIRWNIAGSLYLVECKIRKSPPLYFYKWLEGVEMVFWRGDRRETLVTMRLETLVRLIDECEQKPARHNQADDGGIRHPTQTN